MRVPGPMPDDAPTAVRLAAESLTLEFFARVDRNDVDSAVALYADDAEFLGARGPDAIRDTVTRGLAAHAGRRSRHVIGNLRSTIVDGGAILVEYTAVAYTLADDAPPAVRSVLDQQQLLRRDAAGSLRIATHHIFGYQPPGETSA